MTRNAEGHTPMVRFQRANFIVTDLERALVLYRDVLGLSVDFIKDSAPDSYSYPVFEIDRRATLRFAVLSTPTQARVLALTEVQGVALPETPAPRRSAIVLEIGDVDRVLRLAEESGLAVYPEETLVTHDGRRGREVGLVDHDGNLTVIYHIPPSRTG